MKQINVVDTGKMIRIALKKAFPKTKFSVRLSSYSMGHSYTARWTDGPASCQVQPILDRFQTTHFDGMTDSTSYCHARILAAELVEIDGGYVFGSRNISPQLRAQVTRELELQCGISSDGNHNVRVPYQFHSHWEPSKTVSLERVAAGALAHDSHDGEWLSNLIDRMLSAVSLEETGTVPGDLLPEWVRSYKAEVIADNSGTWCANSLRFETHEQAQTYARDLACRWSLVREYRVTPCTDDITVRRGQVV